MTLHARRVLIIHTNLQVKCCVKNRNAIVYNKIKNIKSPNPKASIDGASCHREEQTSHCAGEKKNSSMCRPPPFPFSDHWPPSVSPERPLQAQGLPEAHSPPTSPRANLTACCWASEDPVCRWWNSGSWLEMRASFQRVVQGGRNRQVWER